MLLPSLLLLSCFTSLLHASSDKTGFVGTIKTGAMGGLEGTVVVQDPYNLVIKNYQLGDASAPALHWWGATNDDLSSGFRISQEQVTKPSTGGDLQVKLDSGHTAADFSTVGLWCERFHVDFGQALLAPPTPGDSAIASTTTTSPSGSAFHPIVQDQYTTARAYFFSVMGMLLLESLLRLPPYLMCLFRGDGTHAQSPKRHTWLYLNLHRLLTLPSPFPSVTTMVLPDLLRLATLLGLNILWGWNRNAYTSDFDVYGWLTLANGGLALLLAARTNIFSIVARIPSPTVLLYHRWTGRFTVIHATIHMAFILNSYIKSGQVQTVIQTLRIQVGLMAWISLVLILITSVSLVRRRRFEAFYYAHALFLLFVIGALIHATHAAEFLVPGLALWAIDRAIRFCYNFRHVEIDSVSRLPGDLTKFHVRGFSSRSPGQIAWIQISGVSWFNWHPFTIASSPSATNEATFAVRGLGNYTKRVHDFATEANSKQICKETGHVMPGKLKMRIDGPYGVGPIVWGYHPVTAIVAGGIGITPGISIASHIIEQAQRLGPRAAPRHIRILWVVKDAQHISWFDEKLASLTSMARDPALPVTFALQVYVTGRTAMEMEMMAGETTSSPAGSPSMMNQAPPPSLDRSKVVTRGRPDLRAFFQKIRYQYPGLDAAVSACGPRPLIDSVRREAVADQSRGNHSGAYHVAEEVFEF